MVYYGGGGICQSGNPRTYIHPELYHQIYPILQSKIPLSKIGNITYDTAPAAYVGRGPKFGWNGRDLNQTKCDTRTRQLGGHIHGPNNTVIPVQATQVARPSSHIDPKTLANHNVPRPGKATQSNWVETMALDTSNNPTRLMPLKAPRKLTSSRFSSIQLGAQRQLNGT